RRAWAAAESVIAEACSSRSDRKAVRSAVSPGGTTTPITVRSGARFRNAMPNPAARSIGNTNTQKTASGSRKNSRYRTRVSCTRGRSDQRRASLIAPLPSGERDEHILQRSRMGSQLGQLDTLPSKLLQQRGHGPMQLVHREPVRPVPPVGLANSFQTSQ